MGHKGFDFEEEGVDLMAEAAAAAMAKVTVLELCALYCTAFCKTERLFVKSNNLAHAARDKRGVASHLKGCKNRARVKAMLSEAERLDEKAAEVLEEFVLTRALRDDVMTVLRSRIGEPSRLVGLWASASAEHGDGSALETYWGHVVAREALALGWSGWPRFDEEGR